jgi:putative hydrolase of the HAD superfamily
MGSRLLIDSRQWLFFDLGSTLIDEDEYLRRRDDLLYELIVAVDHELDESTYRCVLAENKSSLSQSVAKSVIERFVPDVEKWEELHRLYKQQLAPYAMSSRKLYADVFDALPRLAEQHHLGIIADQEVWVRRALEEIWRIAGYFRVIVLSDEIGMAKPDKRMFEQALLQAKCFPEQAMMVGDRPDKDIAPANSLGMVSIRMLRGMDFKTSPPRNELEVANFEIIDLEQLISLVS